MNKIGLMCSYVRLDEISNKVFKGKVRVTPKEHKMRGVRLR